MKFYYSLWDIEVMEGSAFPKSEIRTFAVHMIYVNTQNLLRVKTKEVFQTGKIIYIIWRDTLQGVN